MSRAIVLMSVLWGSLAFAGDDWPTFRGPTQEGHSDSTGLPLKWSDTENVKWKTEIPGQGWSSPVIRGDQIWLTTALDKGKSLHAICVDKNSGKIVHDVEVFYVQEPPPKNGFNSYASPTPVVEDGRVYVCFGAMGSACLDTATGKEVWRNEDLKIDHKEGPGSSPVIYKDLYILHCDGCDHQYVVALDKLTGREVWRTKRSYDFDANNVYREIRKAFSVPLIITHEGKDYMIGAAAKRFYCHDPATGKELWYVEHAGFSNASMPVFRHGLIYLSSGYFKAEMHAVRFDPDARGDVTRTHVKWWYNQGVPFKPSVLVVGDELIMPADKPGIMRSLNAHTGKLNWQKRMGNGYSASPIHADGHAYFFAESGDTVVLKPGSTKEPTVVAENTLPDGIIASPAVSGKALYIRTTKALYRIEKP